MFSLSLDLIKIRSSNAIKLKFNLRCGRKELFIVVTQSLLIMIISSTKKDIIQGRKH